MRDVRCVGGIVPPKALAPGRWCSHGVKPSDVDDSRIGRRSSALRVSRRRPHDAARRRGEAMAKQARCPFTDKPDFRSQPVSPSVYASGTRPTPHQTGPRAEARPAVATRACGDGEPPMTSPVRGKALSRIDRAGRNQWQRRNPCGGPPTRNNLAVRTGSQTPPFGRPHLPTHGDHLTDTTILLRNGE
jgi:hypothetical protein